MRLGGWSLKTKKKLSFCDREVYKLLRGEQILKTYSMCYYVFYIRVRMQ